MKKRIVVAATGLALGIPLALAPIAGAVAQAVAQPVPPPVAPPAAGPTTENVEQLRSTVLSLIRALVEQKILTTEKAAEMLKQAGIDAALLSAPAGAAQPGSTPPPPVVRVPYVPEVVKRELRDEIRQEVLAQARAERWGDPGALPDWLNRISLYGDVRYRFQRDSFPDGNDPLQNIDFNFQLPDGTTRNDTDTRDRTRLRARLGLNARVSDDVKAGLRITTSAGGDGNSPVSTNVDQGQFNRRLGLALDLGFVQWDVAPTASITGGRIANPYFATDLIWANDLTFDGVTANYAPRFTPGFGGFVTLGAHPIQFAQRDGVSNVAAGNHWLYGIQTGLDWTADNQSNAKFAIGYYYYDRIQGELNPAVPVPNNNFGNTVPLFRQRGNTMFNTNFLSDPTGAAVWSYASKFHILDLLARYEWARFDPFRVSVTAEFVRNYGYDRDEIGSRIGAAVAGIPCDTLEPSLCPQTDQDPARSTVPRARTKGYLFGTQIGNGQLLQFGDWQAFGTYRYLQRDAVLDAFTSTDYRLGGTDQKAYAIGTNLGLARNTSITLRYVSAKNLDNASKYDVDSWYIDLLTRF